MLMYNFSIGIVLYNPTHISINRIINFAKQGIDFYIYDNSKFITEKLSSIPNLHYTSFNKNNGLSEGIDYLCKKAINDDHDYLLFFDQDTFFNSDTLNFIQNFIVFMNEKKNHYLDFVVAINFRDKPIKENKLNVIGNTLVDIYEIQTIYFNINSGTLFMLNKYSSFSWFDKTFFVDGVDYAFSLNVLINNFKNLSISSVPGLNHSVEQGDTFISLFGKKIISRVYPLSRNIDFVKAHILLFIKSFKIQSIKPKLFIVKAILSYIIIQTLFRVRSMFICL